MPVRCYTHLNESSVAKSTRRSSGSARGLKSPSQVSSCAVAMVNCCVGGVELCSDDCCGGGCYFVVVQTRLEWRGEETPTLSIYRVHTTSPSSILQPKANLTQDGHADRVNTASTAPQRTLFPPPQGTAHHGPCALDSAGDVCDGVCDGVNPGRIIGISQANGEFCVCHAGRKFIISFFESHYYWNPN